MSVGPDMTGADGRVIFTKLSGSTKINLQEGSFQVIDANGTDANGALFQLPNPDADGVTAYSVYARALGQPGASALAQLRFYELPTNVGTTP